MKSPLFTLFEKELDYTILRTFGSLCFPCLRCTAKNKFDQRSAPYVFLGYNDHHKGYRCLHHQLGRIYISRHVVFEENVLPCCKNEPSATTHSLPLEISVIERWMSSLEVAEKACTSGKSIDKSHPRTDSWFSDLNGHDAVATTNAGVPIVLPRVTVSGIEHDAPRETLVHESSPEIQSQIISDQKFTQALQVCHQPLK
ncbi:hypothetical protein NE237_006434 [Protea cynaroides]|uniref:Retroviral polymerase SH3-like domain-containing protein n=1 Tax=Protea cynaroides TaxID=273540 RepID=A0A9Q0QVF5_9MAGN|nr:hypothetical protein NE237_006434 [Protea cynaroides]